jgi:hypothetical protein
MGYRVLGKTEDLFRGYAARDGLEGPYIFANGRILYYDPREGAYWDPRTDWYVPHEEVQELRQDLVNRIARS